MFARILRAVLLVLAFFYLTQNIMPVPPNAQAIVLRFGKVVRSQDDGVVVAWPPPLERVVIIPDGERQLLDLSPGATHIAQTIEALSSDHAPMLVGATLTLTAPSPIASPLLADAVLQAVSNHTLAEIMADPGAVAADIEKILAPALKNRLRVALAVPGQPGTAGTDDAAKLLADARADAAARLQQTDQMRVRIFADAHARAAESVAFARTATATLDALETRMTDTTRPAVLEDLYREKIAAILHQAGSVSTVDAKSVSRLILPGSSP
jgi:regulator of protease activity HflC (stomatin/prohibitin superfamily)